jgi:hypothetical protein
MKKKSEKIIEETLLSEKKIDTIIKKYLLEREDLDVVTYEKGEISFSEDSKEAFSDIVDGLSEVLVDLDFIKEKEGDVIIHKRNKRDLYADTHLESLISKLTDVVESLVLLIEDEGEIGT